LFGNDILPRAPDRVQKLPVNDFGRSKVDASAAELKEEKSLAELIGN
jgi:hypothetical protein